MCEPAGGEIVDEDALCVDADGVGEGYEVASLAGHDGVFDE